MFDVSLFKQPRADCQFSRDIFPFERKVGSQITHYDHFLDYNNTEIIVLPSYTPRENINVLTEHNFTIATNTIVPSEHGCFAYRKSLEGDDITPTKKYGAVIMTLFYEETNDELEMFYDYYRAHGVEHFYMYYNGTLSNLKAPPHPDITYIEWNYDYWFYEFGNKYHHAQIPAMISFYKRFLPMCELALMVDTDEFLRVDGWSCVCDFIRSKKSLNKNLFSTHYKVKMDREYNILSREERQINRGKSILYSDLCPLNFLPNVHKVPNALHLEGLQLLHNKK
jgi:hypothetical protein